MGFLDNVFKWGTQAFGGVGKAIGGAGKAIGSFLSPGSAASGAGASIANNLMSSFMSQGQKGGQQPMQMPTRGVSQTSMGRMPLNTVTPPTGFNAGAPGAPSKKGGSLMDLFKDPKILGGLGTMAAGQLFGGNPKQPNFNTPEVQRYQNMPLNNFSSLDPNVEAMINRNMAAQKEDDLKRLRDVYKNVRPGTDYTTDSAYQQDLAELERNHSLNSSDALAKAQFQSNDQQMGLNQQELSRASELAQLSIGEIMMKTGMEYEEAQQIKEMFGRAGGMLLSSGLGMDSFDMGGME